MGRKVVPGEKGRAVAAAVVLVTLAAAAAGYAAVAVRRGWGLPCLFRTLTGWLCPGCGMTHAAVALLRLDFRGAFACNALFPVYGAYGVWLTASTVRRYIRTGTVALPLRPLAVHLALFALALGYGVLRNIP